MARLDGHMRKEYQYYSRYCGYNQRLYILLNNQHRTGTNQVEWIHAVALEDHEPLFWTKDP